MVTIDVPPEEGAYYVVAAIVIHFVSRWRLAARSCWLISCS